MTYKLTDADMLDLGMDIHTEQVFFTNKQPSAEQEAALDELFDEIRAAVIVARDAVMKAHSLNPPREAVYDSRYPEAGQQVGNA